MDDKLNHILTLAYELYNKYGIKSITMDDVARKLGISKKTLYQHVNDKADLIEKALVHNTIRYRTDIGAIVSKNLNAIVELLEVNAFMNKMMRERNPSMQYDLRKYYPEIHKKLRDDTNQKMYESIKSNLLKGQKEGIYREEMDIEIICKLHLARMEYKYSSNTFTPEELYSPDVLKEIFLYHLHGIANEKGIQVLNNKLKYYIDAK